MSSDTKQVLNVTERSRWIAVVILLVTVLVGLPLFPLPEIDSPGWLAWLGRFHPLLVHFPAAVVPLLVLIEGVAAWKKVGYALHVRRLVWIVALAGTLVSTALGYILYASGDYGGEIVREHFWGGVATTALLLAAALFTTAFWKTEKRYDTGLLGLAFVGVLYTGHHGGMLTHGADFLTEAMPVGEAGDERYLGPREELRVLDDMIVPALENRCVSCHNTSKSKGGLQLTSFHAMQAGGESGAPLFVAGDAAASELVHRVTLSGDDDDYMPPEGKPPLSEVEIDLISWWIESGAMPDMLYGAGPADSSRALAFDRYLTAQMRIWRRRIARQRDAAEMAAMLKKEIGAFEVDVDPMTSGTTLAISMRIPPVHVDDSVVGNLVEYDTYISSLSLVGSDITDDALYDIGRLPALRSLYLAYTAIDGSGLSYLEGAPQLERLNLSHTQLSSEAALHLSRLPALQEVYLFDTAVDSIMVKALRDFLPGVEISLEEGPLHHGV